jgi:site-specific recombinase XerD
MQPSQLPSLHYFSKLLNSAGEEITPESPLFVGRTKKFGEKFQKLTRQALHDTLKNGAKRAGFDGNGQYGVFRAHCLRKFFVTQLTNHGVEDKNHLQMKS